MNKHFVLLVLFFAVACADKRQKTTSLVKESQATIINDSTQIANDEKELFVERGRYEDDKYEVVAFSRFMIPGKISNDSSYYFEENILSLTNKNTNRNFKIQLTFPCTGDGAIRISNETKPLKFKKPLFEITTPDCSDWFISEFIQLETDSLRKLFEISDTDPVELARPNEYFLIGTSTFRDEIVGNFSNDTVKVSLADYSVKEIQPPIQKIGFNSEALEDIHGYRINNNLVNNPYIIKEGEKLIIDTLFREAKKVILIVKDSIRVICPTSEVKDKIKGNAAG
jgi:hypothetical protein